VHHRLTSVVLIAAAASLVSAGTASAEGANSIAGAPSIVPGQQEFGNLVNGLVTKNECEDNDYSDFWALQVTAGDQVAIDWEAQQLHYTELNVYPAGTTDFDYPQTERLLHQELNSNLKDEATLTANSTSTLPIKFTSSGWSCLEGTPGPYAFTVTITHGLSLGLPHVSSLPRQGTVSIGVHNPEGGAISDPAISLTLQIKGRGLWKTIGTARDASSTAVVHFVVPSSLRRQRVTLRALASGPGYVAATSGHLKVRTR
jgi:hypothetical protein